MAIREDFIKIGSDGQQQFIDAVWALKRERSALDGLSTYDRYVLVHQEVMTTPSIWSGDVVPTRRNYAHRGPVFLPWHREFLLRFEADLQRVLGKPGYGLPYWNWAVDGDLDENAQLKAPIWGIIGGDGDPNSGPANGPWYVVTDGPFGTDRDLVNALQNDDGTRWASLVVDPKIWKTVERRNGRTSYGLLQRRFARGAPSLPNSDDVSNTYNYSVYDGPDWNEGVEDSFRNQLEGFRGPGMHNLVHQWVGGSMGPGTSPNDPVFFLHHCNVDRIWEVWRTGSTAAPFEPQSGGPTGHNLSDDLLPWNGETVPDRITVEEAIEMGETEYR